jgi:predicted DNA repair protein MutK
VPAGSLLALLDDIASVLDDVATMTKVAAKKSAGILGDDLALNAQQVAGVTPDRELPVIWAVAKGSLRNKAILVPVALALSAVAPWAVLPLLMVGGAYLCFEGFEKVVHRLLHPDPAQAAEHAARMQAIADPAVDLAARERERIRGAVRTDFVLSAEIVAITLGAVSDSAFAVRAGVVIAISILMTVGVYGFVAAILKVDDLGLRLASVEGRGKRARARRRVGRGILAAAPVFLRLLSIVGTAAMFLVGGGIIAHGIPPLGHAIDDLGRTVGGAVGGLLPTLLQGLLGVATGAVLVLFYVRARRAFARPDAPASRA